MKNKKIIILNTTIIITVLMLESFVFAQNFLGPSCSAGQCQGRIGVDANSNVSVGTSTPQSDTRIYIVGSTSDSSRYGLKIMSSNLTPVLWVRNDGRVSIGTTTFNYVLNVSGDIYTSGNLIIGGNFSAPLAAGNVTPGVFNSLQGGGTGAYAFLGSLGVATTSQVGLPQALSVYGNGYFSGNVGIGVVNPTSKIQTLASGESNYFIMNTFSNTQTNANGLRTMRARGSSTSPSNVANSDGLFYLSSLGYYSGGYRLASEIAMIVDGVPSGTTVPGRIELTTLGSGGGGIAVLKSNGNFGIGTTTPAYKLDVFGGQINASGGLCIAGDCKTSWSQIGGSYTLVHYDRYPAGNAQSGSVDMGAGWGSPAGVSVSTGTTSAWIQFDPNTVETAYLSTTLPPTWNSGQVDFIMKATRVTGVGTGNAIFEVTSKCYGDGEDPLNTSFTNTPKSQTMSITVSGTATIHTLTFSNIDMTGCSPGEYLRIRLRRLAADAGDTFGGDAGPLEGIIVWRETL